MRAHTSDMYRNFFTKKTQFSIIVLGPDRMPSFDITHRNPLLAHFALKEVWWIAYPSVNYFFENRVSSNIFRYDLLYVFFAEWALA
jgi:hypothetical protein